MLRPGLALSLSVLVHAAVLAAWTRTAPDPSAPPRLHVQLQQPANAGADASPDPSEPERHTEPKAEAPPEAAGNRMAKLDTPPGEAVSAEPQAPSESQPTPQAETRRESARPNVEEPPAPKPPKSAAAGDSATPPKATAETPRPLILARLHEALDVHFSYPMLARRQGWEGQVLVGFRIESGGRINDVHVARSSGYGVLDRSAVKALDRVGDLPGVETGGGTLEMRIPIIYRLQEG